MSSTSPGNFFFPRDYTHSSIYGNAVKITFSHCYTDITGLSSILRSVTQRVTQSNSVIET